MFLVTVQDARDALWARRITSSFFFPLRNMHFPKSWKYKTTCCIDFSLIFVITEQVLQLLHTSDLSDKSSEARELTAFSPLLWMYYADTNRKTTVRTPLGEMCKYFLATICSVLNIKIKALLVWLEYIWLVNKNIIVKKVNVISTTTHGRYSCPQIRNAAFRTWTTQSLKTSTGFS